MAADPDDPKFHQRHLWLPARRGAVDGQGMGKDLRRGGSRDAFWPAIYDLGATRFSLGQPIGLRNHECLIGAEFKMRSENLPQRDLDALKRAAEVAILLPPGYNLGHVQMGKGSLWGVGELNLERVNEKGVKYRVVMGNFFAEIERCLRLGVAFDLLWDLPDLPLPGYREVVRIREDGKVEVSEDGQHTVLDHARIPERPSAPPELKVTLSATEGRTPLAITARADVVDFGAIYYTLGADTKGVYHNARWLGSARTREEDYRFRKRGIETERGPRWQRPVVVELRLSRPGRYRLRATVDLAGRSAVS